ncbi:MULTISPECIES: hypothetical protein [Subtercola]|uniref:Uncharacterized protein n=1 Tax=Subtercola vilae TaxID=2056433 RepID=A0A4T2BWS7_9MICO|nr:MULTISPECIES: hypothetical protein [Subtercola]MEA9986359.1 hypothetical protein [Subtercola sp. RTI3]TIH35001.1 hypothetical protein D4765_11980 [Subtercola vilae]
MTPDSPVRRSGHRRVRTEAAPGSDAEPQATLRRGAGPGHPARAAEDTDRAWGDGSDENDQRLTADKPPHWG